MDKQNCSPASTNLMDIGEIFFSPLPLSGLPLGFCLSHTRCQETPSLSLPKGSFHLKFTLLYPQVSLSVSFP